MSCQRAIDIIYIYYMGNYPAIFILFFLKLVNYQRVISFESTFSHFLHFLENSSKKKLQIELNCLLYLYILVRTKRDI